MASPAPEPSADPSTRVRLHAHADPQPLATYLAERFAPDCLRFAAASYVEAHHRAIEAFELSLGRPATTTDLASLEAARPDLSPVHVEILAAIGAHAAAGGSARKGQRAPLSAAADGPLRDFFENVYRPVRLLGGAEGTTKLYRILLGRWAKFLGREPLMSDLNDLAVAAFISSLRDERLSPTTLKSYASKATALWRYASRKREVATWPGLVPIKLPHKAPKAWQLEEFSRLLVSCQAERGQVAGIAADKWWYALALVLYFTGGRIGAVLQVRWESVDLDRGHLVLEAQHAKTLLEQRFALPTRAVDALRAIAYPPRDMLFPWTKSPTMLWREYTKILDAAGLATDKRSKFHRIRRTSASHLKAAGGNATEHLGHDSARTTTAYLDQEIVGITSQCHLLPDPTKRLGGKDGAA